MKPDPFRQPQIVNELEIDASSFIIYYLQQLKVEYVFGIPGGAIEPFYNALARAQSEGGPKAVTARHETGAVFMADGYARNSRKLGVCCATTGPGATNLITGVASAYENQVPMLIITPQTAMRNFGRRAFQDSADTGINIVGMMQHCTRYNSMVTHVDQLEQKLVSAIMTAMMPPCGPVHLSIPMDILKAPVTRGMARYELPKLVAPPSHLDTNSVGTFIRKLKSARKIAFVLGAGAREAANSILTLAGKMNASIITTPDGKGLVSPRHPLFRGVIGFAGHESARQALSDDAADLIVVVGSILGEWSSDGWDNMTLLNERLVHIDGVPDNLMFSPMASLHVLGRPGTVFDRVLEEMEQYLAKEFVLDLDMESSQKPDGDVVVDHHFTLENESAYEDSSSPIKPQWLMNTLARRFPPHTKYLADVGNSMAWAIHYLHPFDRRITERRNRGALSKGRRRDNAGLFQCATEFAPMGWAIGNAIGTALAQPGDPIVCITGDGSVLMNGQEMTVAAELNLPVIFVILNDSSLGMVKHGQRLANAEPIGFELPKTNFAKMAEAMGVEGIRIEAADDLLQLDFLAISRRTSPLVLDVVIDAEEVPPLSSRIKQLNELP